MIVEETYALHASNLSVMEIAIGTVQRDTIKHITRNLEYLLESHLFDRIDICVAEVSNPVSANQKSEKLISPGYTVS